MYIKIKPMKKIMYVLCLFGLVIGLVFPVLAGYFVIWIPEKRILFCILCMIAGYLVGMFGYIMVNFILHNIDNYYKDILLDKLGIDYSSSVDKNEDMLLNMKREFEELLDIFRIMAKKEKENLRTLSNTDGLTSLYNHRYFYDIIEEKVLQNKGITILFCDIDIFKMINDTKGHRTGDAILVGIARIIKEVSGNSDLVFRYGGEEFIVLLEEVTREQAYDIAEGIRLKVCCSEELQRGASPLPVTVSIGLASYPADALEVEGLIEKADRAMYNAKWNGRNQCCIYSPEIDKGLIADSCTCSGNLEMMVEKVHAYKTSGHCSAGGFIKNN